MNGSAQNFDLETLLALLLVASATAMCVKWVRLPYAVALVIVGLAIGISGIMPNVTITPDLILLIFLPALLFEASWNLDLKTLRRDWLPITALATVGVVVCMFAVAAVLHFGGLLEIRTALLFGAMVAATDPVSVIALFKQMGIDKRLTMLLEGESIFNDGTAVVLFRIMLALMATGSTLTVHNTIGAFAVTVLGGALVGCAVGFLASKIATLFEDHLLEITLTTLAAYGSYLLAEHLHVSSVISVVAAGIVVGNYGSRTSMTASTRLAVNAFWEYAAFLVNSLVFLLIGIQINPSLLMQHSNMVALAVLAVIVARMLVVYGICPFVSSRTRPIPDSWRHLLFWGGLRGALCMALALSLPLDFENRLLIINMTFGVVLFTLLVPGLTMQPLVKLLGMQKRDERLLSYHALTGELMAEKEALAALEDLYARGSLSRKNFESLNLEVVARIDRIQDEREELQLADSSIEVLQRDQARVRLLEARKDVLIRLEKQGAISDEHMHKLKMEIDQELERLHSLYGEHSTEKAETRSPEQLTHVSIIEQSSGETVDFENPADAGGEHAAGEVESTEHERGKHGRE